MSHDLNLIRSVDRILVISAGRILEEGSPADLLASGGLYAELYARQFGEAAAAVAASPDGAGREVLDGAGRCPGCEPGGVLDDGVLSDARSPSPGERRGRRARTVATGASTPP